MNHNPYFDTLEGNKLILLSLMKKWVLPDYAYCTVHAHTAQLY